MVVICSGVATIAVGVVVFGALIGAVLTFLGAVALVALVLRFLWWAYLEHQEEEAS